MAGSERARYLGTTDRGVHDAGAVEIDGLTLARDGDPVEVDADQRKRLEEMAYHRFAFGKDAESGDEGAGG